jgi:NAD+ kinase
MPEKSPDYLKIALAFHPKNMEAHQMAQEIGSYLESQGKEISLGTMDDQIFRDNITHGSQDLLLALGGDGTMLRAGHISAPSKTPILGINLGSYGFLTEIQKEEWQSALTRVLKGDYWLEERLMLQAVLTRNTKVIGKWNALNDAVISRGETIRPIKLGININTRHLSTIVADAIIASTATGSTAYAMAAGGPILSPDLRNILLVPVAPHLSIEQSLVLSENVVVSISVQTSHQAVISIDGQAPIDLASEDQIEITASGDSVQFIRFQDPGYFYRNLIPYMDQNPVIKKNNV